jgi:hypothetical protein
MFRTWWYFALLSALKSISVNGFHYKQEQLSNIDSMKSKFYIFDWPIEIQSSIPPIDAILETSNAKEIYTHQWGENYGNGRLMNDQYSLYQPSIYQFYHFAMSKLRVHPRRTMDRSEAEFFVMPYDIGFSAGFSQSTGELRSKPHLTGCPEYQQILTLLQQEIQQTQLFGNNILILNSFFDFFPKNCRAIISLCLNCTFIRFDFEDYRENKMYHPQGTHPRINRRVFSVPFPTHHRWDEKHHLVTSSFTNLPIVLPPDVLSAYSPHILLNYSRPILASFWGSNDVWYKPSSILRTIISVSCASHPKYCYYLPVGTRLQRVAGQNLTPIEIYSNTVFCLQPPGDLESRKGIFDSFSLGCIPVISANGVLSKTYPWFFTKEMEERTTIYVPYLSLTRDKKDIIKDILLQIPLAVIRQKQEAIEAIAKSLQYAVPPPELRRYIGYGGAPGELDGKMKWRPPFNDAIDQIIDSMSELSKRYKKTRTITEVDAPNRVSRWDYLWIDYPAPRNPHPIVIN